MKNLKKVLSLALVFALSLTLFAGAAFTDEADIGEDYKDDVNMLVQLGVIGGYDDGTFRPQNNITRAEFTKMAYTLKYGYDDQGRLFAGQKSIFTDVEGDEGLTWAKGYINYCANQNIIGGVGNNKFNPKGNVTVAEASKMLLVILGCDPIKEGFGGVNWSGNVVAKAMELGVFDGWVGDPTAPASRELVAKLMRNTVFAPVYIYNPITGVGSQVSALDPTVKNETLGEQTMGLKHITGIVVSNENYALTVDEEGKEIVGSVDAQSMGKSQVYYEYANNRTGEISKRLALIDRALSDDMLGSLVDVYFTADGQEGNYANIEVIGDVIVNAKTKAYDVFANDIKIMPDGDSNSSRLIAPYILFQTADGTEERVEIRSEDAAYSKLKVPMNEEYYGAVFSNMMFYSESNDQSNSGDVVRGKLTQPVFDVENEDNENNPNSKDTMVTQMGKNYAQKYRFVSVDGGETYSYILRLTNIRKGTITSINDTAISVSGAGGSKSLEDEVILHGDNFQRNDTVMFYMKDGKLNVEPTETITGKATSLRNNVAVINDESYTSDLTSMRMEIGQFFTEPSNSGMNSENTQYIVYNGFILDVDGTAISTVVTDYAVVIYSSYDRALGTATVKLAFSDNSEGVYEVSDLYGTEEQALDEMRNFANNAKVGGIYKYEINGGMVDLSAIESPAINTGSNRASISDGRFRLDGTTYSADSSSLVYLIYGGKEVGSGDLTALKAKAYKLEDITDLNQGSAQHNPTNTEGGETALWAASALQNTGIDNLTTLLVGSMTVGTEMPNIATMNDTVGYLLSAEYNYNIETSKWYLEVAMITDQGLFETRTIDEVPDDNGSTSRWFANPEVGEDAIDPGTIVSYKTSASDVEGEGDIITSLGDNNGRGAISEMAQTISTNDTIDNGFYYVNISAVRGELVGFYPYKDTAYEIDNSTGRLPPATDTLSKDKNEFTLICIDDGEYVEGGEVAVVSDADIIPAKSKNAIIQVVSNKIQRIYSLLNEY